MEMKVHKPAICSGFTLSELMVILAVLGILASAAVPVLSSWLPRYRLKSAVRELYTNIQFTKMMAVKTNDRYRLVFNTAGNGSYRVERPDGTVEKTVDFSKYGPHGHVGYGGGDATRNATVSGGPLPEDYISYQYNRATFNSRCVGSAGYVYLANSRGAAYAVGTWSSGNVIIKRWDQATGSWQ